MSDDEEARKRRAERLRRKIDELTSDRSGAVGPDHDPAAQRPDESDAEYVERRMREIDRKEPGT
jgi:hypothetical protein